MELSGANTLSCTLSGSALTRFAEDTDLVQIKVGNVSFHSLNIPKLKSIIVIEEVPQ
jgi:molybdenum cofactor biosynthesis enzyme MoaA